MFGTYIYLGGSYNNLIAPFYIFSCTILLNDTSSLEESITFESPRKHEYKTEAIIKITKQPRTIYYRNIARLSYLFDDNKLPYIVNHKEIYSKELDSNGLINSFNTHINSILFLNYTKILTTLKLEEVDYTMEEYLEGVYVLGDFNVIKEFKYDYFNKKEISELKKGKVEIDILINYKNYFFENKLEYYNTFYPSLELMFNKGEPTKEHIENLLKLKCLPDFYIKSNTFRFCHRYIKERSKERLNNKLVLPNWYLKLVKELYNANILSKNDFRYYQDI